MSRRAPVSPSHALADPICINTPTAGPPTSRRTVAPTGALTLALCLIASCGDDKIPGGPDSGTPDAGPVVTLDGSTTDTATRDSSPTDGAQADAPPTCGNGALDQDEQCDGADLHQQTCQTQGFADGELKCAANCTFDTSSCVKDTAGKDFGEKCGQNIGDCKQGLMCVGFSEGNSGYGICTTDCDQNKPCPSSPAGAECVFKLQNGSTICGWLCDAQNTTCPTHMNCNLHSQGYHWCSTDPGPVCGNNTVEAGEECDGTNLNNKTCQAFGFQSGAIKCDSACKYDKTACTGQSPTCANLPQLNCTGGNAACSKLELFEPFQGDGYVVTHGNSYSWLRHDTAMIVKYAAASVKCLMPGSYEIGLGDMSMKTGGTPANSNGQLRHPQNTHDYGRDIDMAYYQKNTSNNHLRPVCPHTINGQDQYHCTGAPNLLDGPRSALYIAKMMESPRVRVIGVDGKIGQIIESEAQKLVSSGMISNTVFQKLKQKVAYEVTNTGQGWYNFHHHHMHLSSTTNKYPTPATPPIQPTPGAPASEIDLSDLSDLSDQQLFKVFPVACEIAGACNDKQLRTLQLHPHSHQDELIPARRIDTQKK